MGLFSMLKQKGNTLNLKNDIIAGIIVALVSIPISMGYAQIAGLPVIYGLYGSLLPILFYGILTTSPQFVVGVDAMPAAMVGAMLSELGIAAGSEEALGVVPLMAWLTAGWFLVFYLIRAGRIVKYISTPVMGGFISGVGITIIMMQIPKLFGGNAGTGELFPLLGNILTQLPEFHPLSAGLGFGTVFLLLLCKKLIPKVPMTVIMMGIGAALQVIFHLDSYGVKLLPEVTGGLPRLVTPSFEYLRTEPALLLLESLSIAAVIMAQTLLATGNYASKYNDIVDNNKEMLAYAAMNAAGGAVGCCPINGSVSRSGIADSFGARSQIMSLTASGTMLLVLLFGTPFLKYLPVPILTGIVMTALIGIIEFDLQRRLWQASRSEWMIFMMSLLGVLLFGTVNGVMIGCVLSFAEVAIRATAPPTAFVGRIPGQGNFYPLGRNSRAREIEHAIIYRFSGNLFFANIDRFQQDIMNAIQEDTRVVVVDARGIGNIDITATDRLVSLHRNLKNKGIAFYITEHDGSLNDQLRILGAECLLEAGAIRRTITLALQDVGIEKPYRLKMQEEGISGRKEFKEAGNEQTLAELEWIFGSRVEEYVEKLAEEAVKELTEKPDYLNQRHLSTRWGHLNPFDENEFLEELEVRLEEMLLEGKLSREQIRELEQRVEDRRLEAEKKLQEIDPRALHRLRLHREQLHLHLREKHPEEFARMQELQKRRYERLKQHNPALAEKISEMHRKVHPDEKKE
ncbi:MAG: SulP family inorganic anion transporter [Lachnospiraceae bacterium]|nr:SulP family inorganic anion transporter [Lachnospiraceae bacterium]